jgi:hypothetical protein
MSAFCIRIIAIMIVNMSGLSTRDNGEKKHEKH